jgi:rhodanese-related sulfurtransferase
MKTLAKLTIGLTLVSTLLGANGLDLKGKGVSINYLDEDTEKTTVITRIHDVKCKKVSGGNPNAIWGGSNANPKINKNCVKSFVTTTGTLSPINMGHGIETYGEIEVINFIKKAQNDENMMLIDARMINWNMINTIPSSINIPFKELDPKLSPDDIDDTLEELGVTKENGKYNFTNAKTLTLFCNGAWCLQSTWAIENLLKLGYPADKLKWYRAGMYGWSLAGLTTVVPD